MENSINTLNAFKHLDATVVWSDVLLSFFHLCLSISNLLKKCRRLPKKCSKCNKILGMVKQFRSRQDTLLLHLLLKDHTYEKNEKRCSSCYSNEDSDQFFGIVKEGRIINNYIYLDNFKKGILS